jgi:hypothetical protein
MSGLPPLAIELRTSLEVRFVPKTEMEPPQSRVSAYASVLGELRALYETTT